MKAKTWSRGTNSRLPFSVNLNLNLSMREFFPLSVVTFPEVFARVNSAQFSFLKWEIV